MGLPLPSPFSLPAAVATLGVTRCWTLLQFFLVGIGGSGEMVRLEARFAKAQFPTVGKGRGGYKNRTRKGRSSAKEAKGHLCFAIYGRKEGAGIKERTVALSLE